MPAKNPDERTELARVAAYASWRVTPNRTTRTAPARAAAQGKRNQLRRAAEQGEQEARARLALMQTRRRLAEATQAATVAEQQARRLGLVIE